MSVQGNDRRRSGICWEDGLFALGTGIFSLILYVRTLVPGLLPGDGGEFQTLAYTLGHAHTPGYEVHILLAHIFTLLVPIGDIAYRVNLLSAVDGALTIALVFLASLVLTRSRLASAVAAFALAISMTFWSQSIIAEVYTPGSVFTAAILLLVLLWHGTRAGRYLFAAGLLGGLALGVHSSNSLFAPAIGLLILLCWKDLRKSWKPALGGAVLGLALYVGAFAIIDAMPTNSSSIHSIYQPSISRWDQQPADLDTIGGRLAFLFFAKQWRSAMFTGGAQVASRNFDTFVNFFKQDFAWPLQLLIPVGLVALFVRRWRLGVFFCAAILVHALYTLNYQIGDIYIFFISLYVYLSPLMAEGLAVLLRGLNRLPAGVSAGARPALAVLFLVLAAAPVYAQRLEALQQGELRFEFMHLMTNQQLAGWRVSVEEQVKQLPENAIILTEWNQLYADYYAAEVEQGRNDLLFLETYPYAKKQAIAESLISFVRESVQQGRPVYAEQPIDELRNAGLVLRDSYLGTRRMVKIDIR